ncbi:MAG: hypothetical protein ACRDPD_29390 [Streptosporangiaceae bacterium]
MTILEQVPNPRHRSLWPGELQLGLAWLEFTGGGRPGPDRPHWAGGGRPDPNRPLGLYVRLQHADLGSGPRPHTAAGRGTCVLTAKSTTPVLLRLGMTAPGRRVDLAGQSSIAEFTGGHLARELLTHARALVSGSGRRDAWVARTVRFRDPLAYNDLIGQISARYLGVHPDDVLLGLLADVRENKDPQLAWYAGNGPSGPGETRASYQAEVAAFQELTDDWLRAVKTTLATA